MSLMSKTSGSVANRLKEIGETIFGLVPERPRIGLRRIVRHGRERRRLALADLAVIAHPKSGSTWLRFQLARAYQRKYQLPLSVIPRIEAFHDLNRAIPR